MNGPGSDSNSDDSDDEVDAEEEDIYRRKYQLLLERCEVLQQDNERLVHRAQQVRKLMRRSRREKRVLIERLDTYGDNWRNVPLALDWEEQLALQPPIKKERCISSNVGVKGQQGVATSLKNSTASEKGRRGGNNSRESGANLNNSTASKRKSSKGDRPERDPNAPKRPANPFLQFCQEQRPLALSAAGLDKPGGSGGSAEGETTKQEITKQLASKWNTLPKEDKKVYYDMYEKSKEKYAEEMKLYCANNRSKTPSDDNPS